MAPPAGTLRVGRYFLALAILLAVLYTLVFVPGSGNTPKLGLDLVGGAQVVLQASTVDGTTPTKDAMNEARAIIEDRVNGRGVSNSEVAVEGADRITVTIPGRRADDIDDIGNTALLTFRPLIAGPFQATPTPTATDSGAASGAPTDGTTPTGVGSATIAPTDGAATGAPTTAAPTGSGSAASPQDEAARPLAAAPTTPAAATDSSAATGAATDPAATGATTDPAATGIPGATPSAGATGTAGATSTEVAPVPGADAVTAEQVTTFQSDPTNAATPGATSLSTAQLQALIAFQCGKTTASSQTDVPIVTCSEDGTSKYVLNTQIFPGTEISDAGAVAPNSQTAAQGWTVQLRLKATGARLWADYTGANNCGGTDCTATSPAANFVAFTLDSKVITAPGIISAITGGQTSISGSFTEDSATSLANSLKYGALPLNFKELTSQTVSATLGTTQLEAGLLAGGIGLALVIIYSLLYYRGLGLVTLASLVVSGLIVYGALVILGNQIGFTLTLAGVAGFIVAVGITADSFVVFFERIKDEVHEGRSMRVAVPRAWARARRTVLSADFVSLLAATVLYYLAAGEVRGFAFTLGLSTIIDIIVVFWFTHPLVSLLSRSRAFGSKRFTGLDAVRTAPPPTKPAPGRRPVRPGTRPAPATAGTVTIAKPASSSVAVLDREDDAPADVETDDGVVVEDAVVNADEVEVTEEVADSAVPEDDDPAATAEPEPAPRTSGRRGTPAAGRSRSRTATAAGTATGGSAAERAAARRARLRADSGSADDDGEARP